MSIDIHLYKYHYLDGHYIFEQCYVVNFKSSFKAIIEKALGEVKRLNFYALHMSPVRLELIDVLSDVKSKTDDEFLQKKYSDLIKELCEDEILYLMID